jgi:DNA-nicking Smr family endonuclease
MPTTIWLANGMKNEPGVTDAELFRSVLQDVIPLTPDNRAHLAPPPKYPRISNQFQSDLSLPDTLSDHGAESAPAEFLRNGLSMMALRKLRRGQWPVEDALDLHGLQSDAARRLLLEFLQHAAQRGMRCIRIVHGKGRNPDGSDGILKLRTRHWLTQCPEVLAFCEPPPNEGGSGAVKILLKNLRGE